MGEELNDCATSFGPLFKRQSDRSFPRTNFTNGVMKGKLMAHEMNGLMLVLILSLRSTRGRRIMSDCAKTRKQKDYFEDPRWVQHWIMCLETQIQLVEWLKLPKLPVNEVERLKMKSREYMTMCQLVGKRESGMGFKTMNHHVIMHVPWDILNFGVPENVNTKSDEMHHKDDKKSSQRTQKRPGKFDQQSLGQIENRRVIEIAIEELNGRRRWEYYDGFGQRDDPIQPQAEVMQPEQARDEPELRGVRAEYEYTFRMHTYTVMVRSKMKRKHLYRYQPHVHATLMTILNDCEDYLDGKVITYSELIMPDGQMYRASPHYLGKPWYDWAMVGVMPTHIKCFVDLRELPQENNTRCESKIYMISEPVMPNMDEAENNFPSQICKPFRKLRNPNVNFVESLTRVVPVETITGPACVVPDLENSDSGAVFRVVPPKEWAGMFSHWINQPIITEFEVEQVD